MARPRGAPIPCLEFSHRQQWREQNVLRLVSSTVAPPFERGGALDPIGGNDDTECFGEPEQHSRDRGIACRAGDVAHKKALSILNRSGAEHGTEARAVARAEIIARRVVAAQSSTSATSTQRRIYSGREVAVAQKESSPSPRNRRPEKAEDEEDVNSSSSSP